MTERDVKRGQGAIERRVNMRALLANPATRQEIIAGAVRFCCALEGHRHDDTPARYTMQPAHRTNPRGELMGAWKVLDTLTGRVVYRATVDGRDRCEAWIARRERRPA